VRRCRAVISLLGLLVLLALPGAASATDKPYSVLERIPTAHGCLFASFTGTLHYNTVTPWLRGARKYQGLTLLNPGFTTWSMSNCLLSSGLSQPESPGSSFKTSFHASSCNRIAPDALFVLGPAAGCRGNVAAVYAMTTVQRGYGVGVSIGTNLVLGSPTGGARFCFTLAADVYRIAPFALSTPNVVGRPEHAGYAPRVCIS
jgi:hypothetical protein